MLKGKTAIVTGSTAGIGLGIARALAREGAGILVAGLSQDDGEAIASSLAEEFGVRSVPWLQLAPFELQGSRTKQELLLWLKRAASSAGLTEYLEEVLSEGDIQSANKLIRHHPHAMENVLGLMADPEAKINVRLGVGVIIEEMAESDMFKKVIPQLIEYLSNHDARIRGDACHYLSLTKDQTYVPAIEKLLSDESEEVREIAQDSLEDLRAVNE